MISDFRNFILHKKNSEFTLCRYTLGGFFLASYDDSPAGVFDEVLYYYCFRKLLIQFLKIDIINKSNPVAGNGKLSNVCFRKICKIKEFIFNLIHLVPII